MNQEDNELKDTAFQLALRCILSPLRYDSEYGVPLKEDRVEVLIAEVQRSCGISPLDCKNFLNQVQNETDDPLVSYNHFCTFFYCFFFH